MGLINTGLQPSLRLRLGGGRVSSNVGSALGKASAFDLCRDQILADWRLVSFAASSAFITTAQLQISAADKLSLLNQLDRWRRWKSLDDRRLCLGCGHLITGHEIEAICGETDGAVAVRCPTAGCQSIPLDWILPNPGDREAQADRDLNLGNEA